MTATRYLAVVLVSDLERALRFYTDTLGLRPHDVWQQSWAELWCGDQLVALWTGTGADAAILPPECRPAGGGSTFLALKVDDLDEASARVAASEGRVDSAIRSASHGRMVLVRDPDGAPLLLHEPAGPLPGW